MTEKHPPERVALAVERACRETRLPVTSMGLVFAFLDDDEDEWPSCCNNGCEPCVLTLAAAARRAMDLLDEKERRAAGAL
ncbi:MAG: hypothetical protein R3A52_04025 [Polyangiales bacterium]